MRRRAKIDDNQGAIVKEFRSRGCLVQSLATIGKGCPDLLVALPFAWVEHGGDHGPRRLALVEVKDGAKVASARKLTPLEVEWHAAWAGAPVFVVETTADVQRVIDEARS